MANMYTQDIVLDADGKPVLDALQHVERFITDIQKTISAIGVTTLKDAQEWQLALSNNLKALKQAESDLRALQKGSLETARELAAAQKEAAVAAKTAAGRGFSDPALARAAKLESDQRLASLRQQREAQAQVNAEAARGTAMQIEAEKAYNRALQATISQLERKKTATLAELQAARLETSKASAKSGIRSITSLDDANAVRAARTASLEALRAQREQLALIDTDAAKAIGRQINMERQLVDELDRVIGRLQRQRELENALNNRSLTSAQFEATGASLITKARSISTLEAAAEEKRLSDARLASYRAEREQVAQTDGAAADWLGKLIELEKRYNREIDTTTNRLQRRDEQIIADQVRVAAAAEQAASRLRAEQTRVQIANNKAGAISSIQGLSGSDALPLLSQLQADHALRLRNLREERTAAAQYSVEQSKELEKRILAEEAIGGAIRARVRDLTNEVEAERRASEAARSRLEGTTNVAQRLLAPANVRADVAASGSAEATLAKYREQLALAEAQLKTTLNMAQPNAELIAQANEQLRLARANVTAAEQLVRLEQNQSNQTRQNNEAHRASVVLAESYAREQIRALGGAEALRRAREATVAAEQRLVGASESETRELRQQLELAQARQKATERQTQASPLSTILSPEYGAAAFARTAVYGAAAAAAYTAMNAVTDGLKGVVQMEDELQKLQAISNSTTPQMQQLKTAIYDIGETSRFSTLDLAKISQTLAQAGVTAGQMKDVLKSVTTLANASGSTPEEAVNLVTSALGAFQLQASEAARVADLMTSALNRTKLTVAQTGQAIQYVGSTAYEQNVSLETLLATVGAVAQAGVKSGSTIGTGFRQFLVDLQTPSQKLTDQLKALNLTEADVDVSTKGLAAVLETLKQAGFGSAQAYAGLETRAAAFYLTAKNNIDVMDELQLSFADQNAAAVANERAMNSLTAQWQRFKNLLAEMASNGAEPFLNFLKNALIGINEYIIKYREANDEIAKMRDQGQAGFWNYDFGKDIAAAGTRVLNGQYSSFQWVKDAKIGDFLNNLTKSADEATSGSARLATQISETGDKIGQQSDLIGELEKEYRRLIQQKDSLINNDTRSSAEMSSLMQRFEGLSGYLTNTRNNYLDLTNAVRGFIAANQEALAGSVAAQQANLATQNEQLRKARGGLAGAVRSNPGYGQLTASEKMAVGTVYSSGANTEEFRRAILVLADAARRLSADQSGIGKSLNDLVQNMQNAQSNVSQRRVLEPQRYAAEAAARNPDIVTRTQTVEALIAEASSNPKKYGETEAAISALRDSIKVIKDKNDPRDRKYIEELNKGLSSYTAQLKALKTPTRAEVRAAAAEERQADRAAKLVTQADVDRIGQQLGLALGSGTRTKAEQDALHRAGKTPATGDTSSHSNGGIARDFSVKGLTDAEARLKAATMRAQYAAAGIDAQVQFESGVGSNNGTGRHIHVGVRKGTMRRSDRTETNLDKVDAQQAQAQVQLDQQDLAQQLTAVGKATTAETMKAAIENAKAALDKVNSELLPAAQKELAAQGIAEGSPEYLNKIAQVQQTIQQNVEAYQQKVADALVKSTKAQLDAAQKAYERAVQPAQSNVDIAQAQVSGLGLYSLRNKVPSYVTELANNRVAKAQEESLRAQAAALPAQIEAQRNAIAQLEAQSAANGTTDQTASQIESMRLELEKLMATREALLAQLGAGGLLPLSFSDGLKQAIQAFREAHDATQSFGQMLTNNLGDALETANNGLTTMFTSIMDGSRTAAQAFGDFAKSIMQWMVQMAAKAVATQIMNLLINVLGGGFGGGGGSGGGTLSAGATTLAFNGGMIGDPTIARAGGGIVENGTPARDSVRTRLARGEWVIQKKAVDSVGNEFMAKLNNHGAKALDSMGKVPQLAMTNRTETNVYVVPPGQQPTMKPNDVKLVLTDELMYGDGRKLVQSIVRETK